MKNDVMVPVCGLNHDSTHFEIAWTLFNESFLDHYHDILLPEHEAVRRSWEEISVLYCTLWVQQQLLFRGIETGSIIVLDSKMLRENELQKGLDLYNTLLISNRLSKGTFLCLLDEYDCKISPYTLFFDWEILGLLISCVKMVGL